MLILLSAVNSLSSSGAAFQSPATIYTRVLKDCFGSPLACARTVKCAARIVTLQQHHSRLIRVDTPSATPCRPCVCWQVAQATSTELCQPAWRRPGMTVSAPSISLVSYFSLYLCRREWLFQLLQESASLRTSFTSDTVPITYSPNYTWVCELLIQWFVANPACHGVMTASYLL